MGTYESELLTRADELIYRDPESILADLETTVDELERRFPDGSPAKLTPIAEGPTYWTLRVTLSALRLELANVGARAFLASPRRPRRAELHVLPGGRDDG